MKTQAIARVLALLALGAALCAVRPAVAGGVGTFDFVLGDVRVRTATGVERPVKKGDIVFEGDRILTGANGTAQMRMIDDAYIAVRADTEMNIGTYRYSGRDDGQESAVLALLKGTMRTFTGGIVRARRDRFMTTTPTATIGIRGSGNVAFVSPDVGTLNHTIEGSHVVSSVDPQGRVTASLVTTPGQTVQVLPNQAPVRVPTPQFLVEAASSRPAPGAQRAPGQAASQQGEATASGGRTTSSGDTTALASADVAVAPTLGFTSPLDLAPRPEIASRNITLSVGGTAIDLTRQLITTSSGGVSALGGGLLDSRNLSLIPQVGTTGRFRAQILYPIFASGTGLLGLGGSLLGGVSLGRANLFVDESGSLVRIAFAPAQWNVFDRAIGVQCVSGAPCLSGSTSASAPSPNAPLGSLTLSGGAAGTAGYTFDATGAHVAFDSSGNPVGTATEIYSDGLGLRFGRYVGGTATAVSSTGVTYSEALGLRSALWAAREVPSSLPLTGTYRYLPKFATAPVDNFGNVGRLNFATLDANFSRMVVFPSVGVTFPERTLVAFGRDVPIGQSGYGFEVTNSAAINATLSPVPPFPLTVVCIGGNCAPPPVGSSGPAYGAAIRGGFTGDGTANGAFFRYNFTTLYDPTLAPGSGAFGAAPAGRIANEHVFGLVAFGKGPEITPPTGTAAGVSALHMYSYFTGPSYSGTSFTAHSHFLSPPDTITFAGPNGNLSAAEAFDFSNSLGGDLSGASSLTTLSNAIRFGRYTGRNTSSGGISLTASGSDQGSSFTGRNVLGAFHWIAGPQQWPLAISHALTGTASYSVLGASPPTDYNGTAGTFNSASLNFNFDRQSADASLNVTTSGGNWIATATEVALDSSGGFSASANMPAATRRSLLVSLNGSPSSSPSNMRVELTGPQLNGAIMAYGLRAGSLLANGAVGFGNPSFSSGVDPMQPSVLLLRARGSVSGFDTSGALSTAHPAAGFEEEALTRVLFNRQNPARMEVDSQGRLTQFDSHILVVSGCPSSCTTSEVPARFSIVPGGTAATGSVPAMPAVSGAATVAEFGADPATGLVWGRYSNANFAIVDRVTGSAVGGGVHAQGPINHYLFGPPNAGPVSLPLSGSATYTLVGATSPTDSFGNVGQLTSASLSANFGAQTVNVGVNASVGPRTWSASASNVPIIGNTVFEAVKLHNASTGQLSVSCSGPGCAGNLAGRIMGGFVGSTGQGAGIAYTLNAGGAPQSSGVSVGGVAAFRR